MHYVALLSGFYCEITRQIPFVVHVDVFSPCFIYYLSFSFNIYICFHVILWYFWWADIFPPCRNPSPADARRVLMELVQPLAEQIDSLR